ncbi:MULTISPECIES: molybdopterin-binding protein [unclassified Ensifer]|uniref:molybdopterin-binding protein n=1 Tax=unclassified Ensifer TaxID=2633371 RepID=UPI000812D389|nr:MULTISPECIES: molybdopterin-binding protein [unclassified Ensifer]OCP03451.1 molybdopterin oxidoreductase [Ensifer sp. LC11]OCP03750.1 molybdopterin oxidoreductase [Ensifer sp. LC13]OCP08448.1 molybdopterin oxidoreductase [Ensifer sp. LC14]OCP30219.1 molybdopterin oxidoreductase [Ensifer sp. LC499]
MSRLLLSRRRFLSVAGAAASTVPLAGCNALDALLADGHPARGLLASANALTYRMQRLLIPADRLAPEFPESEIRQGQRPNGSTDPNDPAYLALRDTAFSGYRLSVTGLIERPQQLTLDELRNMPSRTQITRHDCVEGWSCIAKWTGVPLASVLDEARVKSDARYVVFHCFDSMSLGLAGSVAYYESIDMIDARHPQTILAYGLNGAALPVANGAPLRVRIERQLGYKMAKYIRAIEVVSSLAPFGRGRGGYWEDLGYDWYAGI